MSKAICSIPDCGKPMLARTWCNAHYLRWRNNGDPLGGNPTPRVAKALDNEDGTRTCLDCGLAKDLEDFPRDRVATKGRRSNCKPCHTVRAQAWYAANKDEHTIRVQARNLRDADKLRARDKARYERDKPKRMELATEAGHRRRARIRNGGTQDRGITYRSLRLRDGDQCCYCSVIMSFVSTPHADYVPIRASIEHVQPLSKSGTHTWDNVALACRQCNLRKQKRTLDEWIAIGGPVSAALLATLASRRAS